MDSPAIQRVLPRLDQVRRSGEGYTARCPSHDDHQNSLSVREGEDGRVLLKCFAGCTVEAIVTALNLELRDLFADSTTTRTPSRVVTVEDLARDKGLSVDFLKSLGLRNRSDGVLIPYFEIDGTPASRNRLRTALRAKDGSLWLFGKGKPVPYGLHRLTIAHEAGYLILVEGESDCWTLWHHGFPALGIPGADMTGKLQSEHVAGVPRTYIVREPDGGGQTFVDGVLSRLARFRFQGSAFAVRLEGVKDPNALHQVDPTTFKSAFQQALDRAEPLDVPEVEKEAKLATSNCVTDLLATSGLSSVTSASTGEEIEQGLRKLAGLVKGGDALNRAMARELAIGHLKALGFSAPARMVDAALGTRDTAPSGDLVGKAFLLSNPEPWPEPVDVAELLDGLVEKITRYIVLPQFVAVAIALWIVHCYVFDVL